MLIYDFTNDNFTKLALDWEELVRFAKPTLLGGGAGLAIGALLDLLFPSHRNKTLLGGLLGAAGGGLYSLLSRGSAHSTELEKELRELEEFSQLASLTRQPPAASGLSTIKDVLKYNDEPDLYLKTYSLVQGGNLAALGSAFRSQKTVDELNIFNAAVNDAMFARTVRVLSSLSLDDPADIRAINSRLSDYITNSLLYQSISDKNSPEAKARLADAKTAKTAIVDALSAKNPKFANILSDPASNAWMVPHMLFGVPAFK